MTEEIEKIAETPEGVIVAVYRVFHGSRVPHPSFAKEVLRLLKSLNYYHIPELKVLDDEEIRRLGRPQLHLMPLMKSIAQAQLDYTLKQIKGE